jgi:hypothetical protein
MFIFVGMDLNTYRIKESNGYFRIEIYSCKVKGFLWWKTKECGWRDTNLFGEVYDLDSPFIWYTLSPTFYTLKEAKKQIQKWQSKPIYHNV